MRESNFTQTLADRVRSRRKDLDLSLEQVAQLAECGLKFVFALEHAKPTLRLDKVLDVLNVLGLDLDVIGRATEPRAD